MNKTTFSQVQQDYISKNQLDAQQLESSIQKIIKVSTLTKYPTDRRIAFIVGGQPGSGKSGIIGNIFANHGDNYVLIDNDDYRSHHPNVKEINQTHPEIYTECTDQLSFATTPRVIDHARENNYNMIIHQTLKNDTIINCAITDLTRDDYVRVVVVMAADEKTSNEGMLRRCQEQLQNDGTCRWVPQENHDFAYNGLPQTVENIEKRGLYDAIVVVLRSEDPNKPNDVRVIHRVYNPNISEEHKEVLMQYGFDGSEINKFGTSKNAVLKGREMDSSETMRTLEERLKTAKSVAKTSEELVRIKRLENMYVTSLMSQSQPE